LIQKSYKKTQDKTMLLYSLW